MSGWDGRVFLEILLRELVYYSYLIAVLSTQSSVLSRQSSGDRQATGRRQARLID